MRFHRASRRSRAIIDSPALARTIRHYAIDVVSELSRAEIERSRRSLERSLAAAWGQHLSSHPFEAPHANVGRCFD